jgi:hypothetical protein
LQTQSGVHSFKEKDNVVKAVRELIAMLLAANYSDKCDPGAIHQQLL